MIRRGLHQDLRLQAALILFLGALVYWPALGRSGFSSTEGHRVIPGWEMLEPVPPGGPGGPVATGLDRWLLPRMFGQVYLRKPPGMPWVVAVSASLLGESEWSARAVSAASAVLAAVVSFAFATRWFGAPWGLAAGIIHLLTPWFWSPGRAAEIESLNNLATHTAALLVLDILLGPAARSHARAAARVALAALAITAAGAVKGPAGVPVLAGAILAAVIVRGSWRPLAKPGLWIVLLMSAAALTGLGLAISQAVARAGPGAVTQSVGDFLWDVRRWPAMVMLPLAALGAGLPGTLAIVFGWSPAGRAVLSARQRGAEPGADGPSFIARALAWSVLLSLVIFMAAGVSNPRYAMPAMGLPAVLAGHAAAVAYSNRDAKGARVWRALTLTRVWIVPALLLVAAAVYIPLSERQRDRSSGRAAGRAVGELLPDGAEVWADHVVEARPEILLYARARAEELGRRVTARWRPASPGEPNPSPGPAGFLLLRRDTDSGELTRYEAAGVRFEVIWQGRVHKFDCVLARVRAE